MYNLPEFPSTPDSFAKKVQQAVKEGMEGENMGKRGNSKIVTNGWKKKAAAAAHTYESYLLSLLHHPQSITSPCHHLKHITLL